MTVSVTALMDNRASNPALVHEFGFSLLVQAGERRILFDAGASGAFLDNAHLLNAELSALDAAVLSHGHIDHCRGLCRMIDAGLLHAPLYLHRDFFTDRYWDKTATEGYLEPTSSGLDAAYLVRQGIVWRGVENVFHLFPEVEIDLVGNFRRTCRFEPMDPDDLVFTGGGFRTDDYRDELVLVVRAGDGLVVITGCAHTGLVNICAHVEKLFALPVIAYVGGTHLAPSPIERTLRTIEFVNESSIRVFAPCHCTGAAALDAFQRNCPAFTAFSAGDTLVI